MALGPRIPQMVGESVCSIRGPLSRWRNGDGFPWHFEVSTCAGEELFLVRGKQSGLWQLPGGMIEAKMAVCFVNLYKFI